MSVSAAIARDSSESIHRDESDDGERRRIAAPVVAGGGRSPGASELWEEALDGALRARVVELADEARRRGDPVARALAAALERAEASGEWGEVAELAHALDAHRRARAGVVPLDSRRSKREGKG